MRKSEPYSEPGTNEDLERTLRYLSVMNFQSKKSIIKAGEILGILNQRGAPSTLGVGTNPLILKKYPEHWKPVTRRIVNEAPTENWAVARIAAKQALGLPVTTADISF